MIRTKKKSVLHYQAANPFAYLIYQIFLSNHITKSYFNKMKKQYTLYYPGEETSINRRVSMLLAKALGLTTLTALFFVGLSHGDLFYMCLGIWISVVLFTYSMDSSLEKIESKLLLQLGDFLTSLRHTYHETGILDTAIYMTLPDLPEEIGLHVSHILGMLEATDTEMQMGKYGEKAPNRFFMTFASICASIKEYGDKEVEGHSLFLTNLNYVKEEINIELLKKKRNDFLFSGLIFISLAPVFLCKPLEYWMVTNMPEMKAYYKGFGGNLSMIATFVMSFVCYQMIRILKDGTDGKGREHAILQRLLKIPIVVHFLSRIENANYGKTLRIHDYLRLTGDSLGTRGFLLKRILMGLTFVVCVNLFSSMAVQRQKREIKTNFTGAFENTIVPSESYRKNLEETAATYTQKTKVERKLEKEAQIEKLQEEIVEETGIKPRYASQVAQVVWERILKVKNTYYTWWMLLSSLLAGIVGYYLPYWMLLYQKSIVNMSMEDEVVQFQTLILILMYEDGVTLSVVLDQMERFSFCFRESIRKCIVDLERNQQDALAEMRDRESFPPFKRFVDNLLSVDSTGMEGAFDEVHTERDYYKKKREEDNEIFMSKKSSLGKLIAFVPYGLLITGHLLLPFLTIAMRMFGEMTQVLY